MRRPLCVFCAGTLGLELVCAFLPQTGRFVPFAAFFIAGLLWALAGRLRKSPAWGYGICLILGAVLGLVLTGSTQAKWEKLQTAYDGRSVLLEAEVESTAPSYFPGRVRAVLRVETVDREAASLRVECASLPTCSPGDRVKGRFALETPDDTARLNALADGIALNAAYEKGFALLGQSTSFHARTARLQKRLSAALRQGMASGPAGVLAAMVTGDRTHLSKELRTAYRGAGLSHVLVVSGMHVSILCGDVLGRLLPSRKKRLRGYTGRRVRALFSAVLALLLVGVTGFTPSVLRAAGAVWLSALGVWVYGPPDALTSLGVAGVLMTAGNSYAVCDVGFQLSFAAVVGTLAGGAVVRRSQEAWEKQRAKKKRPRLRFWKRKALGLAGSLWETVCISACASMATFPVLVLRGMSTSLYALVSGAAVLWLVEPILLTGLGAALLGLVPALAPAQRVCSCCAELLAEVLDRWALWVSGWPGAQIWFDTAYAAVVCLLLAGLCWLAFHNGVRLRVALPALLLTAGLCCGTLLFAASAAQQIGITLNPSTAKAGFLTAMYVVLVPVFGLFLGRRGNARLWLSMVIAVGGLYLLCMKNGFGGIEASDWILLSCAVLFSFQIMTVDHFAPQVDGVRLSLLQFFVVAVESTAAALLFENPTLAEFGANWLPLAYCGVMSSGVAYTLQILGQRDVNPAIASLIMCLESVFSALGGWLLLHQSLSMREVFGCTLIFAAVVLAQLPVEDWLKCRSASRK